MKIAIIGAGISGSSFARMCKENGHQVHLYERKSNTGGLVACSVEKDNILFHRTGGHVFNTKYENVAAWFWKIFSKNEFVLAKRNAQIFLDDSYIKYPIENNIHQLPDEQAKKVIKDLLINQDYSLKIDNFKEYLLSMFGKTLCEAYFFPYNEKIWSYDISKISIKWLDGKLPAPSREEILTNNILKKQDSMPHATFYYPSHGGSQFIVDRLLSEIEVVCGYNLFSIEFKNNSVILNDSIQYDVVVYTGDVRKLADLIRTQDSDMVRSLEDNRYHHSHGTTSVLCECDQTDLSWLYLPEVKYNAHRIIFTGNFSNNNNGSSGRSTCVVEFTNHCIDESLIMQDLKILPGNLSIISINRESNSYVMQADDTREKIRYLKKNLEERGFYLLGRFAEWEYYNMDVAMKSAMDLLQFISKKNHKNYIYT